VSHETKVEDILGGVHDSLTDRIVSLVRQMGTVEPEITLTGGVSRNAGMVHSLENRLNVRLNISPEGEYAGAIGAALLGHLRLAKKQSAGGNGQRAEVLVQ
jgi:activator of 2-hydroxyglutaryl-CoA dehydratase